MTPVRDADARYDALIALAHGPLTELALSQAIGRTLAEARTLLEHMIALGDVRESGDLISLSAARTRDLG